LIVTALVVFVVGGIPWTYFNIKYSREVERELARLRAAGEPLTIEEMIPKPVPDEQNAALLYEPLFGVSFQPETRYTLDTEALGSIPRDEFDRLAVGPDDSEEFDIELAREVLSRVEIIEVLAKLEQASLRPRAVWGLHWEKGFAMLLPHLSRYRQAAQLLAMRARLSAADGDTDDALRWVGASLRMSRQVTDEPVLMSQLVAIAVQAITQRAAEEALSDGVPSPQVARRLQQAVASIDMNATFKRALRAERAAELGVFEYFVHGGAEAMDSMLQYDVPAYTLAAYTSPVGAPLRAFDKSRMLAFWRTMMPIFEQPSHQQDPNATERARQGGPILAAVAPLFFPSFTGFSNKRDLSIATLDELCIVLDLKMHKREHGSYPATLDELRATLDRELPTDPFSGEAYRYQRRGEGFILWSVGMDLEDDGGLRPGSAPDVSWDNADLPWECEG
jgi:type II secretory pathway pseudopilin PulG